MSTIYREGLNFSEKARIEKLEMFDEFEEWELLQGHYCICLGVRQVKEGTPIMSLTIREATGQQIQTTGGLPFGRKPSF